MTITVLVPDQLAEHAANQGLSVEAFVEHLAQEATQNRAWLTPSKLTRAEAVASILELQQRNTLAGIKIRDLIQEGRKY